MRCHVTEVLQVLHAGQLAGKHLEWEGDSVTSTTFDAIERDVSMANDQDTSLSRTMGPMNTTSFASDLKPIQKASPVIH